MIGVAERTTMDMDTTVTSINMEESEIEKILIEIFQMDINNGLEIPRVYVIYRGECLEKI